jgi:hypothetical protein
MDLSHEGHVVRLDGVRRPFGGEDLEKHRNFRLPSAERVHHYGAGTVTRTVAGRGDHRRPQDGTCTPSSSPG